MSHERFNRTRGIEPLVSDFAEDADMSDLIQFFIAEMTTRIDSLNEA